MSRAQSLPQAPPLSGFLSLHVIGAVLWGGIALLPLVLLAADLLSAAPELGGIAARLVSFRWFGLLAKSLALAGAVSVVATGLAVALARYAHATPQRCLRRLAFLPLVMLLVPPYLHATAWIGAGGALARELAAAGMQAPAVPAVLAVVWIQVAAVFPITLGFAFAGFRMTDPVQTDAARVFAPDWHAFRAVEWPQMRPAVLIGAALAFLLSLADFSVPTLEQIEVFALEAFVEYSVAANTVDALIVALPHLLIGLVLIVWIAAPVRSLAVTSARRRAASADRRIGGGWATQMPGRIALGFAVLQVAVPVLALAAAAYPFAGMMRDIADSAGAIKTSLVTACLAGGVSVLFALAILPLLTNPTRLALVLVPMAIPATLVGIGAIRLWTLPVLDAVYNTALMPVVVAVAQFSPVAILALFVQAHRCNRALVDAAQVYRGAGPATWTGVLLPLWAPGLWAGFLAVFGLTLTELAASLLISPPGQQMLTAKIFSLLHYGASVQVAELCLVILLASMASMGAIFLAVTPRANVKGRKPA